jgi:riboflavin kinase
MKSILCSIHGKVVKGKQIGRTIGFPTANLSLFSAFPDLEHGVYAVIAHWKGRQLPGVMNMGIRPTSQECQQISYEVHLFDFDQNIYDEELRVDICFFVRKEMTFSQVDELVCQIHKDVRLVRSKLAS